MARRIAPFTLTIALLLATFSAHAQSHSSTELRREQTHAYFDSEQKGGYRFMLTGALVALSGTAPLLYDEEVASMEGAEEGKEEAYNQNDASGFIALNALRLKASARQREQLK